MKESPVSPNDMERQLNMDALMKLHDTLNGKKEKASCKKKKKALLTSLNDYIEQNGTKTDINDLISKDRRACFPRSRQW